MQPYVTPEQIDASTIEEKKLWCLQTFVHKSYCGNRPLEYGADCWVFSLYSNAVAFVTIYSCDNNFSPTEQKCSIAEPLLLFKRFIRSCDMLLKKIKKIKKIVVFYYCHTPKFHVSIFSLNFYAKYSILYLRSFFCSL